jgi:hypothetical protein
MAAVAAQKDSVPPGGFARNRQAFFLPDHSVACSRGSALGLKLNSAF